MSIPKAIEALKHKDFTAARGHIAALPAASYGIQHFLIKGLAELSLEIWGEAASTFTAATQKFPDHALFWLNRGIAEENLGAIDAAIASQKQCLALNPKQGEAYGNLSNLYRRQKNFAEAEQMARQALANGAAQGDALNSLGLALGKQRKYAEAEAAFAQAHQAAPDNAATLLNRANFLIDQLRFDEAWPLFAAARRIEDKAVFRRDEALARLLAGDYERGWALFEARLDMPNALRLHPPCPRWRGEDLRGKKLLIIAEQGFGDVIQFCRYGQLITEGELVWAVPKNLVRLLTGQVRGTVSCETSHVSDDVSLVPKSDYYVPVMSLPFVTKNYLYPLTVPYLSAPSTPLLPKGQHKLKIGLVWAGSRTHERDHERSIRLEQFRPLFAAFSGQAEFYAPFIGAALDEIGDLPIIRLDHLMNDFADTAALIKQMDYLITVDTAGAHLAGALGVKTFLLLPFCPDWRWGSMGDTTPWYPSLTLIRQSKCGDWGSVMKRISHIM